MGTGPQALRGGAGPRFVFAPVGSLGDVFPFVSVAKELSQRGAQVRFAGSEDAGAVVRGEGFEFTPVTPSVRIREIVAGIAYDEEGVASTCKYIAEFLMPNLAESTRRLLEVLDGSRDTIVSSSIHFAAGIVQEALGLRRACLHLFAGIAPGPVRDPVRRALSDAADSAVNGVRAAYGLAPRSGAYFDDIARADSVLLCYSRAWSSGGSRAANTVRVGFPYWDTPKVWPTDARIGRFLERDDRPLVVMTSASGRVSSEAATSVVVAAARAHDARAVLVQGEPWPEADEDVLSVPYVPLSLVMPRARAAVHHGGFGTCMSVLLHRVPSVAVPWGHDQPWNAARLARRGVAEVIPHDRLTPSALAAALDEVLDPCYRSSRSDAFERMSAGIDGAAAAAAEHLLALARG